MTKKEAEIDAEEDSGVEKVKMSVRVDPALKKDWKEYVSAKKIRSNDLLAEMMMAKMESDPADEVPAPKPAPKKPSEDEEEDEEEDKEEDEEEDEDEEK